MQAREILSCPGLPRTQDQSSCLRAKIFGWIRSAWNSSSVGAPPLAQGLSLPLMAQKLGSPSPPILVLATCFNICKADTWEDIKSWSAKHHQSHRSHLSSTNPLIFSAVFRGQNIWKEDQTGESQIFTTFSFYLHLCVEQRAERECLTFWHCRVVLLRKSNKNRIGYMRLIWLGAGTVIYFYQSDTFI